MGRPRAIESPDEFDRLVDEFRDQCAENDEPLTLTGMILHLGLSSRQSLDEYSSYEGFSDSVKRAKLYVEMEYEKRLATNSPTGSIFALKNFGWTDRQTIEHDGKIDQPVGRVQIEVVGGKDPQHQGD